MMKIFLVLMLPFYLLISCGYEQKSDPAPPPQPPSPKPGDEGDSDPNAEFAAEIKPILQKNCAGGNCHTSGGARDAAIQSASNFIKGTSGQRIQSGSMPPPNSSQAKNFSTGEKSELLAFIAKYK